MKGEKKKEQTKEQMKERSKEAQEKCYDKNILPYLLLFVATGRHEVFPVDFSYRPALLLLTTCYPCCFLLLFCFVQFPHFPNRNSHTSTSTDRMSCS